MIARLKPGRDGLVLAAGVIGVVAALASGSSFWLYNLTLVAIFAIAAVGLNLVLGLAGQVSFAQTTFMAIGGYGTAKLTTQAGMDPWLGVLLPAVGAAAFAGVIALPLLRLRGHYLAMATFSLALATNSLAAGAVGLTGGSTGISAIPPLRIGSTSLGTPDAFLVISWVVLGLAVAAYLLLARSHLGRAWKALAVGQDVAASLGVPVRRLKILALVIAAVLGSLAGSLYAQFNSFIAPDFFDLAIIINLFLMVFIGGRGRLAGPVLGSAAVVLLPQTFSGLGDWQNVVFFALLLALMIFLPSGVLGEPALRGQIQSRAASSADAQPRDRTADARPVPGKLVVEGLTKRFGGVVAVNDVSLTVAPGELHGLIGPNGAGKSTLLALISGFVRPDSGRVTLDGVEIGRRPAAVIARRGLARTFQAATPFRGLSVRENLQVGLHVDYRSGVFAVLFRTPRVRREDQAVAARTERLLAEFGLEEVANRSARELPFGQLRFLEIARAAARSPRVLLLDEPAAGLSAVETDRLARLLQAINRDGTTVLVIDHDVPFLFGLCDIVTAMDFGSVIATGCPAEVSADSAVRAAYLGAEVAEAGV